MKVLKNITAPPFWKKYVVLLREPTVLLRESLFFEVKGAGLLRLVSYKEGGFKKKRLLTS